MSAQKTSQVHRRPARGNRPELIVEIRERKPPEPTSEQALADLMRFVQGQAHQADVGLQMDQLLSDIRLLMDDELIASLEALEMNYVYGPDAQDFGTEKALPTRMLLDQLRNLQKTRLRDALARMKPQQN